MAITAIYRKATNIVITRIHLRETHDKSELFYTIDYRTTIIPVNPVESRNVQNPSLGMKLGFHRIERKKDREKEPLDLLKFIT